VRENLKKGRPAESQFAKWVPEAIRLRKETRLGWQKIAEQLSERVGIKIPKSSLHRICQTWLKAEQKRAALPDVTPTRNPPQGRGVSSPNLSPFSSQDDFEEGPKKLIVKTRKNS
jgi:hypothetical protein